MIITGKIDSITSKSYKRQDKIINYKELLISYNFYNGINQIVLLAKQFDENITDKNQLYVFDFDTHTKFINNKLTTDFYLQDYKKLNPKKEQLIVIRTYFEKSNMEILQKQEVKGRIKVIAKFNALHAEQSPLYCYFWEDNFFLKNLKECTKIQLNCRSLPYKDKFISNIEVWRTIENDNFIGSIV